MGGRRRKQQEAIEVQMARRGSQSILSCRAGGKKKEAAGSYRSRGLEEGRELREEWRCVVRGGGGGGGGGGRQGGPEEGRRSGFERKTNNPHDKGWEKPRPRSWSRGGGGRKKVLRAISVDILMGGRKGDTHH